MAEVVRAMSEVSLNIVGVKSYKNTVALDVDDSSDPIQLPHFPDKCVQLTGTIGAAGSITIQGSNELVPTNWFTLHKPDMTNLIFSAVGGFQILENPLWIRGLVTAGDGTTA